MSPGAGRAGGTNVDSRTVLLETLNEALSVVDETISADIQDDPLFADANNVQTRKRLFKNEAREEETSSFLLMLCAQALFPCQFAFIRNNLIILLFNVVQALSIT